MICFLCALHNKQLRCICRPDRPFTILFYDSVPDLGRDDDPSQPFPAHASSHRPEVRPMVDVDAQPGHDRKASRLPVLTQRPAPRSSSMPTSSAEPEANPRRQRSLRKPQQSRIPHYAVPAVSIATSVSPSSKRSTIRQRAEERRSQELADPSSSSENNDQTDSEAKRIRLEAENLIESLSPSNIDALFGDYDQPMDDNEWEESTERFEQIERLHLGSLPSPSFLPPDLAAPISYLEEMERIVHEGANADASSSRRVAEWVDRVTPGVPSSDDSRGSRKGKPENARPERDVNQNPVRSLLAGLAATSSASKHPSNNNAERSGEGDRRHHSTSPTAHDVNKGEEHLISKSTDVLEASVDLMNSSADLLEAAAAEMQRKRSREAEHSSYEFLDRSEQLLESAAEFQRMKRRMNQSTENLSTSMEPKKRRLSQSTGDLSSSTESREDTFPESSQPPTVLTSPPSRLNPHEPHRQTDAMPPPSIAPAEPLRSKPPKYTPPAPRQQQRDFPPSLLLSLLSTRGNRSLHGMPHPDRRQEARSTSPARQGTYGRSSAFYGLGSLDDLPEPPPHLQSPPSSGDRGRGIGFDGASQRNRRDNEQLIDVDPLPPPPIDLLARAAVDNVHQPLRIEPDLPPAPSSSSPDNILQPQQPLHALQLFSPSSEVSPMTPDLPAEPSTPSPLNVDVIGSGPPAHQTVEEFYEVLGRSSVPSIDGKCPSYDESSHGHPPPSSSLLAIVMERRSPQPVQAHQLFSPSSNVDPDEYEETWLSGPFPLQKPKAPDAEEIYSLQESVHPDQPGPPGKGALKHPLDSELEAFLDPSVPRIESASESEGEGRRSSPFKKSVTFDDDTLWHIIEERDNDYYGLGRHSDGEEDEVLLPATNALKRRASESAVSSPPQPPAKASKGIGTSIMPLLKKQTQTFTDRASKGTQSPELGTLKRNASTSYEMTDEDVPPLKIATSNTSLHGDSDEEDEDVDSMSMSSIEAPQRPQPVLIMKPSSWKRELEAYMDEEEAARPVQQPLQSLQPAPVQERNHMASEELEAFLASISEPATVTEEEETVGDSRGEAETTDSNERTVSIGRSVLVEPYESTQQSMDNSADSAPEFLAPHRPQRSMSITSTSSLILDDVHSIRLPGEKTVEEEMDRVHRTVAYYEPPHTSSASNPMPPAAESFEETSALEHPSEEDDAPIDDEASTANNDSSRSGASFAFKDSPRSSSTTSSQPVSSSASTIISSSPRAPGVRIGLGRDASTDPRSAETASGTEKVSLAPAVITANAATAESVPKEREHHAVHGTVTMTYEVEEELHWRPAAAGAAIGKPKHPLDAELEAFLSTSAPVADQDTFSDIREVHAIAAGTDEEMHEDDDEPVQILYGYHGISFKKNPFEEPPNRDEKAFKSTASVVGTATKASPKKKKPARPPAPTEHCRFIPIFTPTIVTTPKEEKEEAAGSGGIYLPDEVLIAVEKRSNEFYFGQPDAKEQATHSVPDLVIDEVHGDEQMEIDVEQATVFNPPPIRPLKIRLPADKSVEEPGDQQKEEKRKHPLDVELEAFLDPSVPRIESASESSPDQDSPESDSDGSGSTTKQDSSVEDSEASKSDAIKKDSLPDSSDNLILEGDATPRHLQSDDVFAEPPPQPLSYTATEANDLAVAAFEKLLEHTHTPGDPLEGAIVSSAYIESDPDAENDSPIPGKRIVLVGKERSVLRKSSDGEDEEVKVEEMVSDGEGGLRPVRKIDERDEEELERLGMNWSDVEWKAESSGEEASGEDTRSDKPAASTEVGPGMDLPHEVHEKSGEGLHLPDSGTVALGQLNLSNDILMAVEQRSNEYYFPDAGMEKTKSIGTPSSSVETVKETHHAHRKDTETATEPPSRPTRDAEEGMLTGVDLRGESEVDGPRPVEKPAEKHVGQGLDWPDDVLIAVEKRSNEYYFPDVGMEKKPIDSSAAASVQADIIEEYAIPKRDPEEGGMLTGVDLLEESEVDGPRPVEKPINSDDVLIAVEKRSNAYYFPAHDAPKNISKQEDTHHPPVFYAPTNEEKTTATDHSPLVNAGMETDESPGEMAPHPPPPTLRDNNNMGFSKPTSASVKLPASDDSEQHLGSGLSLPDDVFIAVDNRSNDYYLPTTGAGLAHHHTPLTEAAAAATDVWPPSDTRASNMDFSVSNSSTRFEPASDVSTSTKQPPSKRTITHHKDDWPKEHAPLPPYSTFTQVDDDLPHPPPQDEMRTFLNLGSGVDLPAKALLEVERRSNEYFFTGGDRDKPSSALLQSVADAGGTATIDKKAKSMETEPAVDEVTVGEGIEVPEEEVDVHEEAALVAELNNKRTSPRDSDAPPPLNETEKIAAQEGSNKPPNSEAGIDSPAAAHQEELGQGIHLPSDVNEQRGNAKKKVPSFDQGTTTAAGPKDDPTNVTIGQGGIHIPDDDVLLEIDRLSNEHYFPPAPTPMPRSMHALNPPEEESRRLTAPGMLNIPNLPPLDQYIFGPEDTDLRPSARLFQKVELVEARSGMIETIERPAALGQPPRTSAANEEALVAELNRRTTPRASDLPVDQSLLSNAPSFSPGDLQSLLKPSLTASDQRLATTTPAADVGVDRSSGDYLFGIDNRLDARPSALPSYGEVRLVSAEEGVERIPTDQELPVHRSRSLASAYISVDVPNLLPSPVPDNRFPTEGDEGRYRPQRRAITEETITTTTIEELLITHHHPIIDTDAGQHRRQPVAGDYASTSSEAFDPQRYPGVTLVAASDGSFKLPARFETFLSLEPPEDEDVIEASEVTPRGDLNVDAAEAAYYRIAQDAAPSLESSGEFDGLPQAEGGKLMSITEILRLTDNCDVKSNYGLDVIQEESEAERSNRSARYEIVRMPELIDFDADRKSSGRGSPADLTIDTAFEGMERHLRAPEDASQVASRLLASLSPSQNLDREPDSDSEAEGEVADWGQTTAPSVTTAEPFEDDLDYEDDEDGRKKRKLEPLLVELAAARDDEAIEALDNRAYSIRDFALTPDAGEVYDSDGLNPSSFREEEMVRRGASVEWIIPSSEAIEEDEEELRLLEQQLDFYEHMISSSSGQEDGARPETRAEFYEETSREIVKSALDEIEEERKYSSSYEDTTRVVDQLHEEMTSRSSFRTDEEEDGPQMFDRTHKDEEIHATSHDVFDADDESELRAPSHMLHEERISRASSVHADEDDEDHDHAHMFDTTIFEDDSDPPEYVSRVARELDHREEEALDDTQEHEEEEGSYEMGGAVPLSPITEESPETSPEISAVDGKIEECDAALQEVEEPGLEPAVETQHPEDNPHLPMPVNGAQPAIAPSDDSDLPDEKTSDDEDQRPSSTSSSPHEDEHEEHHAKRDTQGTLSEGVVPDDEAIRDVEERSNEKPEGGVASLVEGIREDETSESRPETSPSRPVHLVEGEDVRTTTGVTRDDGEVRLVRARDTMRVESGEERQRRRSSAEVEIRLENKPMDSPPGPAEKEPTPLMHPSVSRLGVDSRQPSLDRQSSVTSDEMDRSSLMRLKLENNLDKATTGHEEQNLSELNTADVERFWEYRYNKSPRTMKELEDAKRRATRDAEHKCDQEIRKRTTREVDDGAALDAELNRKLAEAESRFLQRDQENEEENETGRLHSGLSSSRSSPSFVVDNLSQGEEEEEDEEIATGIPLTASGHFFHLRSSSSSSASTASFNSMCDGRQGRVHREDFHGADPLTRERVGGAYERTTRQGGGASASELERLFPYIRHSSYYLNYYRSGNLSMEKQAAPRNDYMLSRGLLRSSSSRDSFGMMRQSASTDFIHNADHSDRKSVTFRQRIEELVHTPPMMHRRIRAGTSAHSHQIRSILKSQHASNLLKIANDNMLRELEQCIEERDRITVNISATPSDVSQLSPMTQSAQTRYRNHMMEQKERISVMIEDKYALIKETLREEEMPSWLRGKDDSISLTLVDQKRSHRRLILRQSSSFFYQSQKIEYNSRGSRGADLVTANDCARKLERLRTQFARRDSENGIDAADNGSSDLLSRISQRLSTSPNRMESPLNQ